MRGIGTRKRSARSRGWMRSTRRSPSCRPGSKAPTSQLKRKFMKLLWRSILSIALLAAVGAAQAQVQPFPERPVRIIFPFPAGAVSDYLIRLLAQQATEELGKTVLVENRSGGAGIPGTDAGAK